MILEIIATVVLAVGLFFLAVAAIDFVRLPDVFCRLHVTGVIDTMGAPVILLAAAIYLGFTLESGKLVLAIVFLYVTAPLVGHLLARAAIQAGYEPVLDEDKEAGAARGYLATGEDADEVERKVHGRSKRRGEGGEGEGDVRMQASTAPGGSHHGGGEA